MLLETMGLFGFVVVIAMDIALIVDSQVLLETMGLFVQMAGLQLFVEEMDLVVPMAEHLLFVEEMDLVVQMAGHQLFVEEMDLVVALDRWWVLHTAVSLLQVVAHMDMIALVVGVVDSPLGVVLYSSQSIANS